MAPPRRADDTTRARLIGAAEQLFAERGIDAVSLREINRASGARNTAAVQYHFADRDDVVRAVVGKHRPAVDARRHELLDRIEAHPPAQLRDLAAALVEPDAAELADPDGGPAYLRIRAELVNRPRPRFDPTAPDDPTDSVHRWRALVGPLLEPNAMRLHRRFTAIRLAAAELGRRAASGPHTDDRLFVSHLVDLVATILATPPSAATVQLADERDARRTVRPGDRTALRRSAEPRRSTAPGRAPV